MGIYDRDYMRNRRPEENWRGPSQKKKTWIIVAVVVVLAAFVFSLFR